MKHILVFAYQISPYAGSEFAVAWNYVVNMSRTNRLTVLYGVSEGWTCIGNVDKMQKYLQANRVENVEFVPVLPDEDIRRRIERIGNGRLAYYRFYSVYRRFHRLVAETARQIIAREKIDLIHYLGPIGYREPGYLRQLGLPYIWGPIGGISSAPMRLLPGASSFRGALEIVVKETVNVLQYTFSRRIRKALKETDLLLVNHTENASVVERIAGRRDLHILPENGVDEFFPLNEDKFKSDKIECIWVGSLDARKSLHTLLKALTMVDKNAPLIVNIVGYGPLEEKHKRYAKAHGIDHFIKWHGRVDREEVFRIFNRSHLHIITSLKEGHTTVIWEAMSMGVPTMTLSHCGMADTVDDSCGIPIPVMSYGKVCREFAARLNDIVRNPRQLQILAKGVLESRKKYFWETRVELWNKYYDMAIEIHNARKK